MTRFLALLLFCSPLAAADPSPVLLLWPQGAPGTPAGAPAEKVVTGKNGERQVSSIHQPSLTIFPANKEKACGAAVLVIPGGGHRMLCIDHEGENLARWLAEQGVCAFVLKHRLAKEEGSTYTIMDHAVPDAQRAMRLIRHQAATWGIDPARLGALGFSAGGELVAQSCMLPGQGDAGSADPVDKEDARPAFQALIYPGRTGDIKPDGNAPPAFLACSANDRQDIAEGLAEVYLRFKRAGASAELHMYADGGHGFGTRATASGPHSTWHQRFLEWMGSRGFLTAAPHPPGK